MDIKTTQEDRITQDRTEQHKTGQNNIKNRINERKIGQKNNTKQVKTTKQDKRTQYRTKL